MSYDNGTPLTDSDNEGDTTDYRSPAQYPPSGYSPATHTPYTPYSQHTSNFTEVHTDTNLHSDESDNSELDLDISNAHQNYIRVHYEGHIETFPIDSHSTLLHLRERVRGHPNMEMTDSHFFLLPPSDNSSTLSDEDDEDTLRSSGRLLLNESVQCSSHGGETLSIYWRSFSLNVLDGMDLSLSMRVSSDWSIRKLKDEIERIHSVRLQCLSLNGMELVDEQALRYHGIDKTGYNLVSRISITIEDAQCDMSTDLLVCDFWDFEAVLRTYCDAERREAHANASFYYEGNKVLLTDQVFQLELSNRSRLEYKVEAYPVFVYDSEAALQIGTGEGVGREDLNAVVLDVWDYWTLADVKKAYSKLTKKPFMEKEKFLSQERELEDNVPLWKLRLRDNEKLIIEREQQEVSVGYICCECGMLVNLRRYDSVQCRQCFHGAVYKQRTERVCQYNCR